MSKHSEAYEAMLKLDEYCMSIPHGALECHCFFFRNPGGCPKHYLQREKDIIKKRIPEMEKYDRNDWTEMEAQQ